MKKNILICCDYYLPGFRSGGLIRSIAAVVEALKTEANITIVTRNHDCGLYQAYDNIVSDVVCTLNGYRVLYLSENNIIPGIFTFLKKEKFDLIYINSFFSPFFSLYPLLLLRFFFNTKTKIIIAPRGEFGAGSLGIKKNKKKICLLLKRIFISRENLLWQATSPQEEKDIKKIAGNTAQIISLGDIALHQEKKKITHQKEKNKIKIVFISRIAEVKNLIYALKTALKINGAVLFDIYGPIEDSAYWDECQAIIKNMPINVMVVYQGELPHASVADTLRQYDLFFLPTLNENYGHAIIEAFSVGCPVLISANTPWRQLSKYDAGWDYDLANTDAFSNKLAELILLDDKQYRVYQQGAMDYFDQYVNDSGLSQEYKHYFLNT